MANNKITQTIEYLTQIHTAWDGSEQRVAIRNEPRISISYDYIGVKTWQSQWLRMLQFGKQTQQIRFPLWHAKCELEKNQYKEQLSINIPKQMLWGFRNISAIELWIDDESGGKVYKVKYITASGVVGLENKLEEDWLAYKTTVIPIFYGVLSKEDNYSNDSSAVSEMTINVDMLQNQKAPPFPQSLDEFHDEIFSYDHNMNNLPKLYNDVEVFTFNPYWADNMSDSFSRNANKIDYNTGVYRYDLKSSDTLETHNWPIAGISRASIYNLQRFFMRHKGRLKSFYVPTWTNDIELKVSASAGSSILLTKFNQLYKFYNTSSRRKTLIVFFKDVNKPPTFLNVTGYAVDSASQSGKVYLTEPLTKNININDVAMISFFIRTRFGDDALKIDYETTCIATHDLQFIEVNPKEGE